MRALATTLAFVLASGLPLQAAAEGLPVPGDRIRVFGGQQEAATPADSASPGKADATVTTLHDRLVGTLLTIEPHRLRVRPDGQVEPVTIWLASVTSLAVRRGTSRGTRAATGAVIGAGVGLAGGLAAGNDKPGLLQFSAGEKALMFAILLAPVGALLGLTSGGSRWEEVDTQGLRLRLGPAPGGGVAAQLSVGF